MTYFENCSFQVVVDLNVSYVLNVIGGEGLNVTSNQWIRFRLSEDNLIRLFSPLFLLSICHFS